jgi:hypothetical protein
MRTRNRDRVGTLRCGVTARVERAEHARYDVRQQHVFAAERGADSGGSATCHARRPYRRRLIVFSVQNISVSVVMYSVSKIV